MRNVYTEKWFCMLKMRKTQVMSERQEKYED